MCVWWVVRCYWKYYNTLFCVWPFVCFIKDSYIAYIIHNAVNHTHTRHFTAALNKYYRSDTNTVIVYSNSNFDYFETSTSIASHWAVLSYINTCCYWYRCAKACFFNCIPFRCSSLIMGLAWVQSGKQC